MNQMGRRSIRSPQHWQPNDPGRPSLASNGLHLFAPVHAALRVPLRMISLPQQVRWASVFPSGSLVRDREMTLWNMAGGRTRDDLPAFMWIGAHLKAMKAAGLVR